MVFSLLFFPQREAPRTAQPAGKVTEMPYIPSWIELFGPTSSFNGIACDHAAETREIAQRRARTGFMGVGELFAAVARGRGLFEFLQDIVDLLQLVGVGHAGMQPVVPHRAVGRDDRDVRNAH